MPQYTWADCPEPTRSQVEDLVSALSHELGEKLMGVYLHGSLAMGCFNPGSSDLDMLVVTQTGLAEEEKRYLAQTLLNISSRPHPVEISVLTLEQLKPWRHPSPYDFHFGEDWRERFRRILAGYGSFTQETEQRDPDLAAHITMTRQRGICLYGMPIEAVLPAVPRQDYLDSIVGDFHWAQDRTLSNPVYFVLNACRVYAYVQSGEILSKDEAGAWAMSTLPRQFRPLISTALAAYRGEVPAPSFEVASLRAFAAYIAEALPGEANGTDSWPK